MITVAEAARKVGRDPETIRRWIRSGRVAARKVGRRHLIEEADLAAMTEEPISVALPEEWRRTSWGDPMPDVLAAISRSRQGH